jgi:hypothetical protein
MKPDARTKVFMSGVLFLCIQTGLFGAPPSTREAHSRDLLAPADQAILASVDWLMDNQYVVRSVNQSMGLVSFHKVAKWKGSYGNDHLVELEGCLLVRPNSNNSSTARLLLNQKYLEAGTQGIQAGLQTDCDEEYYRDVFTGLAKKLSPSR